MRQLVVDASVVVKWLVPEIDSTSALHLREKHEFAAPDLLFAEISNILWKKARRGEVGEEDVDAAITALSYADFDVRSSRTMMADVAKLSRQLDHPAYDCFYLWSAAVLDTVVVTADERLLRKLRSKGVQEWAHLAVGLLDFPRA